jgi:hypothetical protein
MWFAMREGKKEVLVKTQCRFLVAILVSALASVHCGGSDPSSDDGNTAGGEAFSAASTPDTHLIGTWELVQKDSDGKALSLADQQTTVGSGTAAVKEWKPEFSVLRYTFTKTEGDPDTKGNKRFTGSYVLRKDGSDTATETHSIVYSTDSDAGQVRLKDSTSANPSTDTYDIDNGTLTLKSSGHTATFVKK